MQFVFLWLEAGDEFPDLFLVVVIVFNRSGIWKVSSEFLDFLSAVDFECTCFVHFTALISKYSISSSKSSNHSCHACSARLSGILNEFVVF